MKLTATSKFLPGPVKAMEFMRKLSLHLLTDKYMLDLFEKVVDPEISCEDCMATVVRMEKIPTDLFNYILLFFL